MSAFKPEWLPPAARRALLWPGRRYALFRLLLSLSVLVLALFAPHLLQPMFEVIFAILFTWLSGSLITVFYLLPTVLILHDLLLVCIYIYSFVQRFILRTNSNDPQSQPDDNKRLGAFGLLRLCVLVLGCLRPDIISYIVDRGYDVGIHLLGFCIRYGLRALVVRDFSLALGLILRGALDEIHDRKRLEQISSPPVG